MFKHLTVQKDHRNMWWRHNRCHPSSLSCGKSILSTQTQSTLHWWTT